MGRDGRRNRDEAMVEKNRRTQVITAITALLFLLVCGGIGYWSAQPPTPSTQKGADLSAQEAKQQLFAQVYARNPFLGDPHAPVKIVEFGDYKCPACKAWMQSIFPQLKSKWIDTHQVQFFFVNDPFLGQDSTTAALAAEAVFHQKAEAFWTYSEAIYRHQKGEREVWATPEYLVQIAEQEVPGIDAPRLMNDIQKQTYAADVRADQSIADQVGVELIPALFINGKSVDDPFQMTSIQAVIEEVSRP